MTNRPFAYRLRGVVLALAAAAALHPTARAQRTQSEDFALGRNAEVLVNMLRELSTQYVDKIDADLLLQRSAAGMATALDPYTEYLPEQKMTSFEIMTTGQYGGVGSLIRQKGDHVIFAQPYEGSPADRAGIRIGDRIISIDGEDASGFTTEQVSTRLKGDPDTDVRLVVEHSLDSRRDTLTLRRERIAIPSVPWSGSATSSTATLPNAATSRCATLWNGCAPKGSCAGWCSTTAPTAAASCRRRSR